MNTNVLYLLVTLIFITGCTEVIDIDLNETDPALVVEGLITDRPGPYTVKLALTTSYFESETPPTVDAFVTIT